MASITNRELAVTSTSATVGAAAAPTDPETEVGSDRSAPRRTDPRGGGAHVRAGRLGPAGRLGRRGHQDRARRARRRHAGAGVDRRGPGPRRRPRPARALEPGQEEPRRSTSPPPRGWTSSTGSRPRATCSSPTSCPACARSSTSTLDDIRGHNPDDHLRPRARARASAGPDADKGSYDLLAFWARAGVALGRDPSGVRRPHRPAAGPGLRRLHRGHDHRRRDHGRAVPPGAHRRRRHGRRVAARHRHVGHGPGPGAVAAARRALAGPARRADVAQPPGPQLPDLRRAPPLAVLPAGGQVLGPAVRRHRASRAGRRPPLRRPRVAHGQRPRGDRHPRRGLRVRPARRVARPGWRTSPASGPSCRTPSRRPSTPRRWPTATSRTAATAGGTPFQLAAAPVQFDEEPPVPGRAPELNEHGDEILTELGLDWDAIVDLKVRGVVA